MRRTMLLRRRGCSEPLQRLAIVPRHPVRRPRSQFSGVTLQGGQIVEGIHSVDLTAVDQAHEEIAHFGSVERLIEQTVLSMKNRFLQSTLDEIGVQWRARHSQEQCQ